MSDKTLVTGGGGFIGSHLVEELVKEGRDVRAFLHYNSRGGNQHLEELPDQIKRSVEIVKGDIADPYSVDGAVNGCGSVFHLAALIGIPYSYVAPASYVSTNISGTLNVLESARKHGVGRVIHTSTSETYGSAQYIPMDEGHPLVGQSPYSASKIAADKLAESFWRSFETPVAIVRPFNTYGPRQSARAVIPTIILQALAGKTISLGSVHPIRDLTYVGDTAHGFIAAEKSDKVFGEVVNLGVGKGISVGDLVSLIGEILGARLEVEVTAERVRPGKSEVDRLVSDNSKARSEMGWEPKISLRTGLGKTIEYLQQSRSKQSASEYVI